jgi:hypothetical protein
MKATSRLLLLLAAICMICMSSCRNEGACAEDLLKTIPADASAVAIINMEALNEDSISNIGIEPTVAALFCEGGYNYFTGTLSNPSTFKTYIESLNSIKFSTEDDVDILNNVVVKGNRFWYSFGHRIDSKTVSNFLQLTEKQSFLSQTSAKKLKEVEHDVAGWGNIAAIMNAADMGFQQRSMTLMGLQTLFDDPQDISFIVDVKEGEVECEANILNSKGKPARVSFPTAKVNLSNINNMGGNANILVAGEFPAKFISTLNTALGKIGPNLFTVFTTAMQCIDGTIAVAYDANTGNYNGLITTTGKNTASLTDLLSNELGISLTRDGNYLRAAKGTPEGEPVSELSGELKDAMFGVVIAPQNAVSFPTLKNISRIAYTLKPDDGSLEMKLDVKSTNRNENILRTLLNTYSN